MEYYVGQPVFSAMPPEDTYTQEDGPNHGKPVVRGIVTQVCKSGGAEVWWENCDRPLHCHDRELKDAE